MLNTAVAILLSTGVCNLWFITITGGQEGEISDEGRKAPLCHSLIEMTKYSFFFFGLYIYFLVLC
jgi:hypothetical protein